MGRRKSSTGLVGKAFFGVAPLFAVLLTPLYLHSVVQDSDSNDDVFALCVLFVTVFGLSVLGCVLNAAYQCPKNFPLVFVIMQMVLVLEIIAIMLGHSPFHAAVSPQDSGRRHPSSSRETTVTTELIKVGPGTVVGMAKGVSKPPELPALQASTDMPSGKSSPLKGYTDAGSGFCEDGDSHMEFSSMHANGKTLQECADAADTDKYSIAIDFSASDGGCDIRYAAGFIAQDIPGYDWWKWGTGEGKPTGFGRNKHETDTRCYARIIVPTEPPPPGAEETIAPLTDKPHRYLKTLAQEYCFRNVRNQKGDLVNIVLVRAPWQSRQEEKYFEQLKHELLFIGISSLEDFPLPPPNPFSPHFPKDKYVGLFPGFLNMYRNPEKIYPSHVKTEDLSQSDFSLPPPQPPVPKKYDFTFSGTDQDIANNCVGWSAYCKNWSFVVQALEVMCGELEMTGVLVATIDKQGQKSCTIPDSCNGKMKKTQYIPQDEFHGYVRQSRFLFLPQVHDASPRVATQALALNVPLLMNKNLIGGWKYLTPRTGEFFNDMADFRASVRRLLQNIKAGGVYTPREWADENLGDEHSGARFFRFIDQNFRHRVKLPEGTTHLFPNGA